MGYIAKAKGTARKTWPRDAKNGARALETNAGRNEKHAWAQSTQLHFPVKSLVIALLTRNDISAFLG